MYLKRHNEGGKQADGQRPREKYEKKRGSHGVTFFAFPSLASDSLVTDEPNQLCNSFILFSIIVHNFFLIPLADAR